jgi:hypothetical protein
MTESTDLTDVLRRATDGLAAEAPDLLLARAARRGAELRRRRRVLRTAYTVTGLAAACVAVTVALGGSHRPAAGPVVTTPPTAGPTTGSPGDRAHLAVRRDEVGATFARIIPGTITHEHDAAAAPDPGGYASAFDWNGYRVSVQIAPITRPPRAECRWLTGGAGSGQTCVRVRGGWSVHDAQMDDQSYNRWVNVSLDRGFRMWVLVYNSGGEKGSAASGAPPLGVPELEKVATSDLWFD